MKGSLAALLVWGGLTSSSSAMARDGDAASSRFGAACFVAKDADGDGRVTRLEARAAALAWFEAFDRNGDGEVTRQEANEGAPLWRAERFEARFASLDRDGDGALSTAELKLPPRRFGWVDGDADRALTRAELSRAFLHAPSGTIDTVALRSRFWRRDTNRDGIVTRIEALVAADQHFARRDRNRDGVLTAGEASAAAGR